MVGSGHRSQCSYGLLRPREPENNQKMGLGLLFDMLWRPIWIGPRVPLDQDTGEVTGIWRCRGELSFFNPW